MINLSTHMNTLDTIFPNGIPNVIKTKIEFFKELDDEYKLYASNNRKHDGIMFSTQHIKNKNWKGLWLHATGIDLDIYINWLCAGLMYKNYQENTLSYWYKEAHPKEKYIPYSIVTANEDLHGILKNQI